MNIPWNFENPLVYKTVQNYYSDDIVHLDVRHFLMGSFLFTTFLVRKMRIVSNKNIQVLKKADYNAITRIVSKVPRPGFVCKVYMTVEIVCRIDEYVASVVFLAIRNFCEKKTFIVYC